MSTGVARYTEPLGRYANTFVAKGDTGDAYTVLQISSQGSKSGTGFSKKNIKLKESKRNSVGGIN